MEISDAKNELVIDTQREIIQGYYNWIGLDNPTVDQIMERLQCDLDYIGEQQIVLNTEKIINK